MNTPTVKISISEDDFNEPQSQLHVDTSMEPLLQNGDNNVAHKTDETRKDSVKEGENNCL
jgi:hypothetical protein